MQQIGETPLASLGNLIEAFPPAQLLDPKSVAGSAFCAEALRLAADARKTDPERAERMLLSMRKSWRELPVVRHQLNEDSRTALWDHLLLTCLEAFYGTTPTAS